MGRGLAEVLVFDVSEAVVVAASSADRQRRFRNRHPELMTLSGLA